MIWSFSRLNSFNTCKYAWYQHYIAGESADDNFMAQWGSLIHEIMEKFFNGQLSYFELVQYYEDHYDDITYDAPKLPTVDLAEKYYQDGIDYLSSIPPDYITGEYDVLGVELPIKYNIGNLEILGYIDLVLRDKSTGEITILDHKSASIKWLKSGEPSKKDRSHWEDFERQLYIYSKWAIENYGRCDYLAWNMFRLGIIKKIPWIESECDNAINWVKNTVDEIDSEQLWLPNNTKENEFYCQNLCGQRYKCPFVTVKERDHYDPNGWEV